MIYGNGDEHPTILQSIENLENDDYSFNVSDGDYTYKQQTVLVSGTLFSIIRTADFSWLCAYSIKRIICVRTRSQVIDTP